MDFKGFALIFAGVFLALVTFATVHKYVEVRKAGRWPTTTGRILSAKVEARKVRRIGAEIQEKGEDTQIRNFPAIVYEYRAGGRTYKGRRISVGEEAGNVGIEDTLKRYPVGAIVRVFYDPENPKNAVLERDPPPGVFRTMGIFIVCLVGIAAVLIFGTERLINGLAALLPRPGNALAVAALGGLGAFLALVAFAAWRQQQAARDWRPVIGRLTSSEVEAFRVRSSTAAGGIGGWRSFFRPRIIYTYEVDGVPYASDRVHLGGRLAATSDVFARRRIAKYPAGSAVDVFYSPDNPAEAVLERRATGVGWVAALAALLLALAARAGGLV